ncbi:MAG: NADH-quinone oxidoreductase subunit J [Fimbriimonadaceae bacterium]|uniref:NADH-quinone oxidoreductase subunit J n=1 Tax=Candidatus Nitrosymbiomonas proteolyticus TaxID=2608984 RepID=A0A809RU60_9BACT|nr:NADH-quinone oxidoreductase subunit J [Fimbriimonadaceae bacterium]NUM39418.1 NADH-quinone oxidoreductase subunit J [Armatimonadota bacterium]BBO23312.1 NADH dehydrogenase subunit J [Candidatus Nitrosymbiomonas proteolyticus]
MTLTAHTLTFGVLAAIAVFSALGVVLQRDPVRSAIMLVVNFFSLAFLYFSLQHEFLGIVQIIVYTGAIMVLFLFVVMLLRVGGGSMLETRDLKRALGGGFAFALLALLASQAVLPFLTYKDPVMPASLGAPQAVGTALMTDYVAPFEVASVLLLVGLVGSILLAKRRT